MERFVYRQKWQILSKVVGSVADNLSKLIDKDNDDQAPETDIAATTLAADGARVGIGLHL